MKILFYICSISFLLFSAGLQASFARPTLSTEEKLFLSKLDEDFLEDEDPEGWIIFIKQFGKEKIAVQFPRQPHLSYSKDQEGFETFVYEASEDTVLYSFTIETNPHKLEEAESLFQRIVEGVKVHPSQDLIAVSKAEGMLDISYLDRNQTGKSIVYKKRVLAYKNRLYIFTTSKPGNTEDKHDVFTGSFQVIRPLGG